MPDIPPAEQGGCGTDGIDLEGRVIEARRGVCLLQAIPVLQDPEAVAALGAQQAEAGFENV